jgi:fructokinase
LYLLSRHNLGLSTCKEIVKMNLYGGIEAGGTKFVCMVASGPDHIRAETRFPTTTPAETLGRAVQFFQEQALDHPLDSLGVSAFGPLDLDPASSTFGHITATPKPGWSQADLLGFLQNALQIPVGLDTDVNGAALGEYRWGACQGVDPFLYLTIGTGIGGGGIFNGAPMHGLVHPEMGHMLIPHDLQADPFPGACPFHGDCFEGLAAGPALEKRWGQRAETLPPDHPAWELEARYIALAVMNLTVALSPRRIVLGGGVMDTPQVLPLVRTKVLQFLNGYVQTPALLEHIDQFLVSPGLGSRAGVLGAIAIAQQACQNR